AEDRNGRLWIGTSAGLLGWDPQSFQNTHEVEPLQGSEIRNLFMDELGALWIVAAGKGVYRMEDGHLSSLADPGVDQILRDAQCVVRESNGKLWIGAGEDLVLCRDGAEWHRYRLPRQVTASPVSALAATAEGTVWAGSPGAGLFRFKGGKLAAFGASPASLQNQSSALLADQEGNLWVGGGGGLQLLTRKHHFTLGGAGGLGHGIVSDLAEVAPGVIWVTQPGHGLYRWEGDTFRRLAAAGLPPNDSPVGPLLVTRDRACWLACANGLLLFRDPQAVA